MPTKPRVVLTRPVRSPLARAYVASTDEFNEPTQPDCDKHPLPSPFKGGRGRGDIAWFADTEEKKKEPNAVDTEALLANMKVAATHLSKAQRKDLLDHVAALQLGESGSTRDSDMWVRSVLHALQTAIGAGGGGMPGPLAIKALLTARASWAPVESFATAVGITVMRVAERQSAYGLLAKLLVERTQGVARHVGAPLSAKMVANSTGDLAAIFDAAFPGYAASGLAPLVFRRLVSEGLQ